MEGTLLSQADSTGRTTGDTEDISTASLFSLPPSCRHHSRVSRRMESQISRAWWVTTRCSAPPTDPAYKPPFKGTTNCEVCAREHAHGDSVQVPASVSREHRAFGETFVRVARYGEEVEGSLLREEQMSLATETACPSLQIFWYFYNLTRLIRHACPSF